MSIQEALRAVLREQNNQYAKAYAATAIYMSGKALEYQIAYVLSNLGGWRGERAREVKKVLKAYKAKE